MPTDDDSSSSLADRLRSARKRVQRREKQSRASKRAKARRIRKGDPDSTSEAAAVKKRELKQSASETKSEARGLAKDAKQLISSEFGVGGDEAESIIEQGSELLNSAGDDTEQLDADGDGDTDILGALEASGGFEATTSGRQEQPQRQRQQEPEPEPPVGDIEDDFDEVELSGVEEELGFDFPIEDDI